MFQIRASDPLIWMYSVQITNIMGLQMLQNRVWQAYQAVKQFNSQTKNQMAAAMVAPRLP